MSLSKSINTAFCKFLNFTGKAHIYNLFPLSFILYRIEFVSSERINCSNTRLSCIFETRSIGAASLVELRSLLARDARPTFLSTELYLFLEIYDGIPTALTRHFRYENRMNTHSK